MAKANNSDAQRARLKEMFLGELDKTPSVTQAARAIEVDRSTVYAWRDADEAFAAAWDDVKEASIERIEVALMGRAVESSDQAAIFLLKALKPGVYREQARIEHTGAGGGAVQVEHAHDLSKLTVDEIRVWRDLAAKARAATE